MNEIWKDVIGYEKYYQISNFGNLRSKDRESKNGKGVIIIKQKNLKPQPNSSGYLRFSLKCNNIERKIFIHRMVALAFVENSDNKPQVNHKDSNYLNNHSDNLEWVTIRENFDHAYKKGRFVEAFRKFALSSKSISEKKSISVIGENILTGKVVSFNSIQEAGRNGFNAGGVCECCKGTRIVHKGYKWKYGKDSL